MKYPFQHWRLNVLWCFVALCSIIIWPTKSVASTKPEVVLQYPHSQALVVSFADHAPVFAALGICGDYGRIDIYDTRSWLLIRTIDLGITEYRSVGSFNMALSPDGNTIVFGTPTGEVQLWNVRSGKMIRSLPQSVGVSIHVIWSADGGLVAAGGESASRIWNAKTGRIVRSFPGKGFVALSKDGKIFGTAFYYDAFLFDVATGRKIRSFEDKAGVSGPIAISPDGKMVATGGEDPNFHPVNEGSEAYNSHYRKVKLWDARTGNLLKMLPGHYDYDGGTWLLQFTPDGKRLFSSGCYDATLWDVRTCKALSVIQPIYDMAVMSFDGSMVAVPDGGTTDRGAAVSIISKGREIANLGTHQTAVKSLSFSPDGSLLAAGDELIGSVSLRLWNVKNGDLARVLIGQYPGLQNVGFASNQKVFINSLNSVDIWDPSTGSHLQTLKGPIEKVSGTFDQRQALITPDGSKLITESGEVFKKIYQITDTSTGKLLTTIQPEDSSLSSAVFSSDGRYMVLLSGHNTQRYTVWDLDSGNKVSELAKPSAGNHPPMVFSPDGTTIAAGFSIGIQFSNGKIAERSRIVLWDRDSGKVKGQIDLGNRHCGALAFSSDGKTLAVGVDNEIYLYDATSLKEKSILASNGASITALAFSPSGDRIAVADVDCFVQLWEVHSKRLLISMIGFVSPNRRNASSDWYASTPDGFYDRSEGAAKLVRWRQNGKILPEKAFMRDYRRHFLLKDN